MNINLYSATFVVFIFSFYANFFSGNSTQEHLSKEVISPKSTILKLTQANQHFSLHLEKNGISSIQLCNLEKEKDYQLSLTKIEKSCDEQIYFLENPNDITRHLQIESTENCYEILIQKNCDLGKEITLSVQSFTKRKKRLL